MRLLFTLIALVMSIATTMAQTSSSFKLQGTEFKCSNGEEFIVLTFEGKTAKDLYNQFRINASSISKSPSDDIDGLEGSYLKVRVPIKSWGRGWDSYRSESMVWNGSCYLEFQFKDGKVRVLTPKIDPKVEWYDGENSTFKFEIKQNPKDPARIQQQVNDAIKSITKVSNDDW